MSHLQAFDIANVPVGVNESRDNPLTRHVYSFRAVRDWYGFSRAHRHNPTITHNDNAIGNRITTCTVEYGRTDEYGRSIRLLLRLSRTRQQQKNCKNE